MLPIPELDPGIDMGQKEGFRDTVWPFEMRVEANRLTVYGSVKRQSCMGTPPSMKTVVFRGERELQQDTGEYKLLNAASSLLVYAAPACQEQRFFLSLFAANAS
jgi:hypothetical protein